MEYEIMRYKNWFNAVSKQHGIEWAINEVNWDDRLMIYSHVVAVNGEDERIFSTITIADMELCKYSPDVIAENNFKQHYRLIGNVIVNAIPVPFKAFLRPRL